MTGDHMFALHRCTVLVAALLTAAVCGPARSSELVNDNVQMAAVDAEMLAAARPGPVIARESLATETAARAEVAGPDQPTRATAHAARRVAAAAATPSPSLGPIGRSYRPALILGIGY